MKREGRQHGMVRSYRILPSPWNPRPNSRFVNRFDSPPTAGVFTRVQPKPTNHSKFTGKCGQPRCAECHVNPCCKSKDKTKGTQKRRSHDVLSNHKLMTWRVIDGRPRLNYKGLSATGFLEHLASQDYVDDDQVDDNVDDDDDHQDDDYDHGFLNYSSGFPHHGEVDLGPEIQEIVDGNDDKDKKINVDFEDEEDDRDDVMSFCDVGFVLDQVEGDEDWFLVGEM